MIKLVVRDRDGVVVNRVEYDPLRNWAPPAGHSLMDLVDGVDVGWRWDGVSWNPPSRARATFYARDLASLFTPDDVLRIDQQAAASGQVALWKWLLQTRGEKVIEFASPTFDQAWAALTAIVGQERADQLLAQLKGV